MTHVFHTSAEDLNRLVKSLKDDSTGLYQNLYFQNMPTGAKHKVEIDFSEVEFIYDNDEKTTRYKLVKVEDDE